MQNTRRKYESYYTVGVILHCTGGTDVQSSYSQCGSYGTVRVSPYCTGGTDVQSSYSVSPT